MSFSDIANHRRKLLVNPLFWTACHLDAFACSFQHVPAKAPPQADVIQESSDPYQEKSDPEMFCTYPIPHVKLSIFSPFLLNEESVFDKRRKGPGFWFAGKPVHQPRSSIFCQRTQEGQINHDGPFLGYIDYLDVFGDRISKLSPSGWPVYSQNPIHARLFAKKMARITPQEWTEDPYFICLLLSMAQYRRRHSKDPPTRTLSTRLIVVNRDDRDFLHLYEAQISCDFLDMLENYTSTIATTSIDGPTVCHRKIPYRPFEDFPERIRAETHASATADKVNVENGAVKRPPEHEDDEGRNVKQKH